MTAKTVDVSDLMKGFPAEKEYRVHKGNWMTYPYNRWSLLNVTAIHGTAAVERGTGTAVILPEHHLDLGRLDVTQDGKHQKVDDFFDAVHSDALVVLHKGQIVHEQYWNGMNEHSLHLWFSMSKSIIGLIAAIQIERGILDRNALVTHYVPELENSGFQGATIGQVLDMTVAMEWDETTEAIENPNSLASKYSVASGMAPSDKVGSGVFDFLPDMEKENYEHGLKFSYVAPNADLAAGILSRVTGKAFHQLLADDLWSKLGVDESALYILDGAGMAWATGGMNSTARDVAKLGQMILQKGRFNGQNIVSEAIIDDIVNGGDKEAFRIGELGTVFSGYSYRNFWWLGDDGTIQAKGVMGQTLIIYPEKDVVIVKFASREKTTDREQDLKVKDACDAIAYYLSNT